MDMSRRQFQGTLGSLVAWSLLNTVFSRDAVAADMKQRAEKWLSELQTMSLDLKGKSLDVLQWQRQVEELFAQVDLPEFLKFIDFEKLTTGITFQERGELSLRPKLPKVEGLPTNLVFGNQVFALRRGHSVVPHGHDNMATAFLILKGDFHGRHFDRLEDDATHMVIKPTLDGKFGPGGCSTVSDQKDNVHWFEATSDEAYIFNIHVLNVKPGKTGRVYVDPNGEKLSGGRIRARKINHAEANRLYG